MKYIHSKDIYKLFEGTSGIIRLHVADVDMLPAAEVTEVKQGEWVDIYGGKYANPRYKCSVCGSKALYKLKRDELDHNQLVQVLSPGCPNCLAKMSNGIPEEKKEEVENE